MCVLGDSFKCIRTDITALELSGMVQNTHDPSIGFAYGLFLWAIGQRRQIQSEPPHRLPRYCTYKVHVVVDQDGQEYVWAVPLRNRRIMPAYQMWSGGFFMLGWGNAVAKHMVSDADEESDEDAYDPLAGAGADAVGPTRSEVSRATRR